MICEALANALPPKSVKVAVCTSSESFTPITYSASGTSSSATGGRPRLISLDISSTSRKNPSDINSAVSAVTDPGLMFNVRAIFALAILPDARTSSKIC